MANKKLKSIKGKVMRLTRLDECGAPLEGTCSSIVTAGFVTVTLSNEVEAGQEYTQKNAWGDFCISEKDADRVKWVNVSISMCEVDPGILDLVGGANPVNFGGDNIGATFGSQPNPNSFALEVWTKIAGADACTGGDPDWGYFTVPFIRNGQIDGDVTIENGPLTIGLKGEGVGASATWGTGPYDDNPLLTTEGFPSGDLYGMVITTVQPPEPTSGCVFLGGPFKYAVLVGDTLPTDAGITASDGTNATALGVLGYVPWIATAWTAGQFMTVGTYRFYWTGTAWHAGVVPIPKNFSTNTESTIVASDSTNATRLGTLGYSPVVTAAWTTGDKVTFNGYLFNWTSTAWAAGAHA